MTPLARLVVQYAQFGAVGLIAAATHVLIYSAGIMVAALTPLVANAVAFGIAVMVSFFGHSRLAFREQMAGQERRRQRAALMRFVVVALIGFALNSLAVHLCVNVLGWPDHSPIVFMLTVVPLTVFALSKLWVVTGPSDAASPTPTTATAGRWPTARTRRGQLRG